MTRSIVRQAIARSRRINEQEFIDEKREEAEAEKLEKLQTTEHSEVPDDDFYYF